jgi:DNA polymerase-3 subunit alpha
MKNEDFTHIHVHTEYSHLDGFGSVDNYARKAALLGFKYLGITDHAKIDGLIKFQNACDAHGIKPVLGCEAYIVEDVTLKKRRRGHITLWIKNKRGFKNLCKLMTMANLDGFYYRPRIQFDWLLDHCKGLCIGTACTSTFAAMDGGQDLVEELAYKIDDDLYCEVMPHKMRRQYEINDFVIQLAADYNLKVIATNDCHYISRGDYKAQEILLAIQSKAEWNDPKRWKFAIRNLHLRTALEMRRALDKIGFYKKSYLRNTLEIAEKCSDFRIPKQEINLPRLKSIDAGEENAFLRKLVFEGYRSIFEKNIKNSNKYFNRFEEEYKLIVSKKFVRYFLIVWDLINWCKENDILVGPGRGSVGGSLICYLIGITSVDPIKHNLPFSRFINEDRIDFPDIDIDFEHTKRHLVREYLEEKYGTGKVAGVSSYNRMKSKAVIKDVSKVFGVPFGEVNSFTKLIEDGDEPNKIQEAIEEYEDAQDFAYRYPDVIKYAQKIEGQIRGYGQHAAALVVSNEDIGKSGRCVLMQKEGTMLINWEKEDTEYVGLLKIDALGLKLLSIIAEAIRMIKKNHKKNIDLPKLNIEDKSVLSEISNGNTVGLFQLNTYATTSLIKEMGIEKFKHISDAVALVRPGPAQSGMTAEYIKRKHGKRWSAHKQYKKITRDTYGLLVYQEQVMEVINKIAGLPYSTADKIRKIIGKKRTAKEFKKYKRQFIKGCLKEKIFSRDEAEEFWEGLQEWARYGFNRAHSVEYAILGYWCAWLKKYYPTEFACATLTYGSKDKKSDMVEEAYRLGLTLVLPKVGISDPIKWVAKDKKLYIPFIEVKGIGNVKAYEAAETKGNRDGLKKFFNKHEEKEVVKHKGKFGELLDSIGAYDVNDPVQITEDVKKKFDFRIVTNPRENYPKLYKLFGGKIRLDRLDLILNGDYKELRALAKRKKLIRRVSFDGHDKLRKCDLCELREECESPVQPSPGLYNVPCSGEAPGFEEDRDGEGFVGASGKKVWKYLKPKGYIREMFHVTNMNKCYPSDSRKPNKKQIKTCGDNYLDVELKEIKPKLILAYGNTNMQYFLNRSSGIISMSGKTTWSERYGAWIAWCIHPAATLHNPDNEIHFIAGMKNFTKLLHIMGPQMKA